MIHFFSNHKDTSDIEALTGEKVEVIPHPYVKPQWTTMEILCGECSSAIDRAIKADQLIINGDYTLVSLIVLERNRLGKETGFLCMEKLNAPTSERDAAGNIIHQNILKPVNIRWI